MEPTTWKIAIAVLALLLCLRRRRTGDGTNGSDRTYDDDVVTLNQIEKWRSGQ